MKNYLLFSCTLMAFGITAYEVALAHEKAGHGAAGHEAIAHAETASKAHSAAADAELDDSRTPSLAYSLITQGNKRFVAGEPRHADQGREAREKLVGSQHPHTIVLSCSDSRVPPELVFDQGLGQLFTVRVAGNIVDPATVASVEYAVEHLGAKLIVVMGHESCGAVKAALATPPGQSAGSRDLDTLVAAIRPNLGPDPTGGRSISSENKTLRGPVKSNVGAVAQDLTIRSKIIRSHVETGELAIVPAIYSLESGAVEFWNDDRLKAGE